MTLPVSQFELDVFSGVIVGAIVAIATYLSNSWRKKKNQDKKQNIIDNRFKEAILTLAEAFDNETRRLHPDQNIPLISPKIQRLVQNGENDF